MSSASPTAAKVVEWIPTVLGGRYDVRREVGRGGMAVVLEAMDRMLGRLVAVKVLLPHLVGDPAFVERFRQEARSAARLSHPNVVAIFDVGSHAGADSDEIDFIVMELVEGRTLRSEVASGPLPPDRAVAVALDVCAALEAAHACGLVHRDIKPANVMLPSSGPAKVMDFGLAQALDAGRLTQTGLVIATAQYASPEQLQGQDIDARSDVYSLGCCLYEMLAGVPPFAGGSPVSVAFRQVNEAPVPLREHNPMLSAALAAVVERALEKDPARRYQSAAEMGGDLSRVLAGGRSAAADAIGTASIAAIGGEEPEPGSVPDVGSVAAPGRSAPRLGRVALIGVVAAAGVLAGGLSLRLVGATPVPAAPPASSSAPVTTTRAVLAVPPAPTPRPGSGGSAHRGHTMPSSTARSERPAPPPRVPTRSNEGTDCPSPAEPAPPALLKAPVLLNEPALPAEPSPRTEEAPPTEPAATEPAPTEPAPTESASSEPAPPTEPAPTDTSSPPACTPTSP
jgi:hypothetical protein